jgi:hypothetical protein
MCAGGARPFRVRPAADLGEISGALGNRGSAFSSIAEFGSANDEYYSRLLHFRNRNVAIQKLT